jgi:O-antigen/teichoic acid export membrane protein
MLLKFKRKLASNSVYLFFNYISVTLFSFFFWLVIGKMLLPEKYGIISTASNLSLTLVNIFLFGFPPAIVKLIPEYLERKSRLKVGSLIKLALKIVTIANGIVFIVLILFSSYLEPVLNIPADAIVIVAVITLLTSFSYISEAIVKSFQDMKKLASTTFIGYIFKFLVAAILVFIGFSYIGGLMGFVACYAVIVIFRLNYFFPSRLFKKSSKSYSKKPSKISQRSIMKRAFFYSVPMFIGQIFSTLVHNGQYVLLTFMKGAKVTGLFSISTLITSPILVIPTIMNTALAPIVSQLSVKKRKKEQGELMMSVFRYALFLAPPLGIMIVGLAQPLIILISRPEYLSAQSLFPVLMVASVIYAIGNVFISGLYYASGKSKLHMSIIIATTLIYFCTSIPLTYYFSALGLSLAYLINITLMVVLSCIFVKRYIPLKFPKKTILKLLAVSAILYAFIQITSPFVKDMVSGMVIVAAGALLYLLILVPLKFYTKDDIRILNFIAVRSPVLRKQLTKLVEIISKIII